MARQLQLGRGDVDGHAVEAGPLPRVAVQRRAVLAPQEEGRLLALPLPAPLRVALLFALQPPVPQGAHEADDLLGLPGAGHEAPLGLLSVTQRLVADDV